MPKPMVRIGGIPILIHIIKSYLKFNFNNFYVALGYKSDVVKKYFKNFKNYDEKFKFNIKNKNCYITLSFTGKKTLTGGRLKE